jgi:CSLREA domain-containing protein
MNKRTRLAATTALLALAASALMACDIPVPPPSFVVNTEADGADATPGDGTCEMDPGAGNCSLRAAVGEGNALGSAAITLPAGTYDSPSFSVTGDITINDGAPVDARLISQRITVAAGASLVLDGISSFTVPGVQVVVDGAFVGRHLSLVGLESIGQLDVGPTGAAVVENSLFAHVFGVHPTVTNEGTLVMRHTALLAWSDLNVNTTAFHNSGTAHVTASVLQQCTGTAPLSLGYNNDVDGSCGLTGTGDQSAAPPAFITNPVQPVTYDLALASPLVDAIPVGVAGCGAEVVDDMSGAARPTDGNGDGTPGCDIGARERPEAP